MQASPQHSVQDRIKSFNLLPSCVMLFPGFEPAGEVSFVRSESGGRATNTMTLTLRYTLPEPAARWKIALVVSPVVQGILHSRMVAGMKRFAAAMQREHGTQSVAQLDNELHCEVTK